MERPFGRDPAKGVNDMAAKKKKAKKAKPVKKSTKKAAARKTTAKKAKKAPAKKRKTAAKKKAPARKAAGAKARAGAAKKSGAKAKKKQIVGEGDYQASRAFLKDQSSFVDKNRDRIPAMGQEAEQALDGPQGDALRDAEASAAGRSRDTF
jgi:hypothetical protein